MKPGDAQKVVVVVPAHNEEKRILGVLRAISESSLAGQIIVVSDGSLDRTADVAREMQGVSVINLPYNMGKGAAMCAGAAMTDAPVIAFVDADLSGLTGQHIDQIIRPVLMNECDMCVGIFRGGRVFSNLGHRISPFLSGQRAIRRELFESVPYISELRMGVEMALTKAARRRRARVRRTILLGVSNCHKEQKLGLVKGTAARVKMYQEIAEASLRPQRPRRYAPRRPR